jgi:hypothetical protein
MSDTVTPPDHPWHLAEQISLRLARAVDEELAAMRQRGGSFTQPLQILMGQATAMLAFIRTASDAGILLPRTLQRVHDALEELVADMRNAREAVDALLKKEIH